MKGNFFNREKEGKEGVRFGYPGFGGFIWRCPLNIKVETLIC